MTATVRGEMTADGFVASINDLNQIRATDPGRIRRQLATRRRRDLFGPERFYAALMDAYAAAGAR